MQDAATSGSSSSKKEFIAGSSRAYRIAGGSRLTGPIPEPVALLPTTNAGEQIHPDPVVLMHCTGGNAINRLFSLTCRQAPASINTTETAPGLLTSFRFFFRCGTSRPDRDKNQGL